MSVKSYDWVLSLEWDRREVSTAPKYVGRLLF